MAFTVGKSLRTERRQYAKSYRISGIAFKLKNYQFSSALYEINLIALKLVTTQQFPLRIAVNKEDKCLRYQLFKKASSRYGPIFNCLVKTCGLLLLLVFFHTRKSKNSYRTCKQEMTRDQSLV